MYFEIVAASGGFRGHIKDANHKLIWWTEVYTRKENAVAACALVKTFAADAPIKDRS